MNEQLKTMIEESSRIVFFGGAGVSTESNIPDFRSSGGIYQQKKYPYPAEVMLSSDFFYDHTRAFYDFYFHEMIYPDARPEPCASGAGCAGACRKAEGGHHAEHRRLASAGRKQGSAGAAWKREPQPLPELPCVHGSGHADGASGRTRDPSAARNAAA